MSFLAYKFRGVEHPDRLLEIIRTDTVWCADWRELNDPMEGMFRRPAGQADDWVSAVIAFKLGYRVCSLAGRWDFPPLWAYYASDFRGVAIEFELPGLDAIYDDDDLIARDCILARVDYRRTPAFAPAAGWDPRRAATMVLLSKHSAWRHEQEIRLLARVESFRMHRQVSRVLLGHRIDPGLREEILDACERRDISAADVRISGRGLTAAPVRIGRRHPARAGL
ncbi:MAG: DUF2971 domain-containing protein [Caulobacter sp.]|nr:DUF2971 domain-containing protein [Caulobacter sp.]